MRQEIKVECPKEANAKALDILNKGVDSLGFYVKKKDLSPEYIETLLNDICAECIELNFSTCQGHTVELAKLLVAYFQKKEYDLTKLQGSVNYDPMGKMMVKGKDLSNFITTAKELVEVLAPLPKFRCICVNAIDAFAPRLSFFWAIGTNHFMEIAKMRAARMLWADIVKEHHPQCNCQPECPNKAEDGTCFCACKMVAHAETSTFNLTLFDAHVNLLRTQTEAMSAALAGVNSITVTPFDKTYETPDDFSERIARNQQLLLKEECHFNKVVDPAAGSYFIENLTISIATQAWELFLKVEDEGGMLEAVKAGKVQEAINASNKARHDSVSKRKEILLGTNQYPNFNEKAGEKAPVEAKCCCGGNHDNCEKPFATLNFDRAASQFEALRLQTEKSGKRPKAFMLTIGNLAMRQARAQFSCNFLACAGYEVIDNLGFPTVEAGVEAAMKAGADIVVICSSDDEYAEYAIPAFKALNGRAIFIVAGAPACMEELKAAGIENFIHVRVNVLDTLKEYNAKLGIK